MTEHTHPFIVHGNAESTQAQLQGAIGLLQRYHELQTEGEPPDDDPVHLAHWGEVYVLEGIKQAVDHLTDLACDQAKRGAYIGLQPVEGVSQ